MLLPTVTAVEASSEVELESRPTVSVPAELDKPSRIDPVVEIKTAVGWTFEAENDAEQATVAPWPLGATVRLARRPMAASPLSNVTSPPQRRAAGASRHGGNQRHALVGDGRVQLDQEVGRRGLGRHRNRRGDHDGGLFGLADVLSPGPVAVTIHIIVLPDVGRRQGMAARCRAGDRRCLRVRRRRGQLRPDACAGSGALIHPSLTR